MIRILILLTLLPAAYGERATFDVAAIKPASQSVQGGLLYFGCHGGPGTQDPGRWTCENITLANLVVTAFELKPYQFQTWYSRLENERFSVTAKIPEGATKEQFRQMQQNLLIERFGLKYHFEKEEIQGYELVLGKKAPKFKESEPEPHQDPQTGSRAIPGNRFNLELDKEGFPILPPGGSGVIMIPGRASGRWPRMTMEEFATNLSSSMMVDKPVADGTGLKGKFDLSLHWAAELPHDLPRPQLAGQGNVPTASEPSGPNIFTALQEQLSLKLQPKRVAIDRFMIDHIEKTPTEN
jgi:uncharacterized protein (TIGR03435 family)